MKIRLIFEETEPHVPEGTYVYNTGEIEGLPTSQLIAEMTDYVIRSLHELRVLTVKK